MKKKLSLRIGIIAVFVAGLSLMLYPSISNAWNTNRQKQLISHYETQVEEAAASSQINYEGEKAKAVDYNNALLPSILPDSFAQAEIAEEEDEEYMSSLNLLGDGMMGYVTIPKINVRLPLYHTTDEEVLQTGVGHLEGSSLPVGGASTHSVLSAHRGLPSAALFTDLDKMELGDHFLINVLDETLCYEVDQIMVVEPTETEELAVIEGEDLVTLMTCTPYGVNSQRLFVRGHRTAYEERILEDESVPLAALTLNSQYYMTTAGGIFMTALAIAIMFLYDRRSRMKAKAAPAKGEVNGEPQAAGEKENEEPQAASGAEAEKEPQAAGEKENGEPQASSGAEEKKEPQAAAGGKENEEPQDPSETEDKE